MRCVMRDGTRYTRAIIRNDITSGWGAAPHISMSLLPAVHLHFIISERECIIYIAKVLTERVQ